MTYGVGYIGEGEYKASHNGKHTKEYSSWKRMLNRCYCPKHHTKDTLLHKMGYDEDLCFETDVDLKEAVEENPEAYNIELKTKLDSMNDQDIYDRFTTLLYTNKLTHQQWDEILSKYE